MLTSRNTSNNDQATTAHNPKSSLSDSSSSSSTSDNPRKPTYDFQLPTTINANKSVVKTTNTILPPPLTNFGDSDSNNEADEEEDEDQETSASLLSKRNATPAALNHLKNIESIIQGDETPRTRTIIKKVPNNEIKDIPVEYDDESMSQSVSHSIISSVDDITVDKASPSPSAHIDFLEDL